MAEAPDRDTTQLQSAISLGNVSIFGGRQFQREKCHNCANQAGSMTTRLVAGQLSITNGLMDIVEADRAVAGGAGDEGPGLHSLKRKDVVPFLRKWLSWKIVTVRPYASIGFRHR